MYSAMLSESVIQKPGAVVIDEPFSNPALKTIKLAVGSGKSSMLQRTIYQAQARAGLSFFSESVTLLTAKKKTVVLAVQRATLSFL